MGDTQAPGVWYKKLFAYLKFEIHFLMIGVIAIFREFTTRPPILNVEEMEMHSGDVAIIIGGPRGLAVGLLKRLLQLDYTVIMGCSNVKDSQKRLQDFEKSNPNLPITNVTLLQMDLKSISSVKQFADVVLSRVSRIDLLLCNACIMRAPFQMTEDGYESHFQVNYLSQFLLTQLFLDKLKSTGKTKGSPTRIIYTSTMAYSGGVVDFNELGKSIVYTPTKFYSISKLCQIMSMLTLEKQLQKEGASVHCYAVHPGLIPTDLWYSAGGNLVGSIAQFAQRVFRNIDNGADTILWPAFCSDYQDRGGLYMESGSAITINPKATNESVQSKLYSHTQTLILTD